MKLDVIAQDYNPAQIREPFSVCMTVLNEAAGIVRFLNSLFAQSLLPDDIVIVDAGSTDETCNRIQMYRDVRINLIRLHGASPAKGRNVASAAARYDSQVMVDAGTVLDKNLFVNLTGPLMEGADIAAGIYGANLATRWAQYFIPDWRNTAYLQQKFFPSCRCAAIRKSLVVKIGFNEGFGYKAGEDTFFMMRAREVSSRWVLNRNAYVGWDAPTTQAEAIALARHYGIGNGQVGCDLYGRKPSTDPVLMASYEGYLAGQKIREAIT